MKKITVTPKYYDIEVFRRQVNRKLWFGMGILGCVAVLCVLLAMASLLKPTPVIAFDQAGRPMLFKDTTTPALQIDKIRVEYVVKTLLDKYVAINSQSLEGDFKEALNLMTPRLRELTLNDTEELKKRAAYRDANISGHFEKLKINLAPYDPQKSTQIRALAWGQVVYEPWSGNPEPDEEPESIWIHCQLVLKKVPVAPDSIHGLLVDYMRLKAYPSEEELRLAVLKRKP